MFDVVKYKGQKVEGLPYSEKLDILRDINRYVPELKLPAFATTLTQKMRLLKEIKAGTHPTTREGVVIYDLDKPIATKAKISHDYDAKIVGVFDAKSGTKYYGNAVGGFVVSPEYDQGVKIRVGTGISDKVRRDAFRNPSKYLGQ